MFWSANASAIEYNLYRGSLHLLGPTYSGDCLATTADPSYEDSTIPNPGQAFFYLVTMETLCAAPP